MYNYRTCQLFSVLVHKIEKLRHGLKEVTEKAMLQLLLLHPHGGNDRFFLVATSLLASEDSSEVTVDWTVLGSADGSQISRGNVSTN